MLVVREAALHAAVQVRHTRTASWTIGIEFPEAVAVGCAKCWPRACGNGAHSEFGRVPHHWNVVLAPGEEATMVQRGEWLVRREDGTVERLDDPTFWEKYEYV